LSQAELYNNSPLGKDILQEAEKQVFEFSFQAIAVTCGQNISFAEKLQKVLEENPNLPKASLFFLATDIFNTCTTDIKFAFLSLVFIIERLTKSVHKFENDGMKVIVAEQVIGAPYICILDKDGKLTHIEKNIWK
jgi:hypothetical protein